MQAFRSPSMITSQQGIKLTTPETKVNKVSASRLVPASLAYVAELTKKM
jgi:hypothetical protein